MRTYVIADIGANHDGDLRRMLDAVYAAQEAGCSAIKFQWTSDAARMAARRGRAAEDGYAAIYARYLQWPREWHGFLAMTAKQIGIDYLCTVFLPEDVAAVAPYVARFKVASFEAADRELLAACIAAEPSRDVLVSLGMGQAVDPDGLLAAPDYWQRLRLLHCVSCYPTPPAEANLRRIALGGVPFGTGKATGFHGFSDHTPPGLTYTGGVAVAAGAQIVEAHLRLNRTDQKNPDYPHAMAPDQFDYYVSFIRTVEELLGDGRPAAMPCEQAMAQYRVGAPINRLEEA